MKLIKVAGETFANLFNGIYLNGIIEECILKMDSKGFFIQAVDLTNSVFVSCQAELHLSDIKRKIEIGLGNLGVLCKLFSLAKSEEIGFKIEENRLVVNRGDHGKFQYLLSDSEVISTGVEDEDAIEKLVSLAEYSIDEISEKFRDDYLFYIGLTGLKVIKFTVDENEIVKLSSGDEKDHKFEIILGEVKRITKKKVELPFDIQIYAPFFTSILQVLFFSDEKNSPEFCFSQNSPMIIKQNNNVWAVLTISDENDVADTAGEK